MIKRYLAISTELEVSPQLLERGAKVIPYRFSGTIKPLLKRGENPEDSLEVHYRGHFNSQAKESIRHLPELETIAGKVSQRLDHSKRR
ncbi:hypothetical protein HN604_01435 [archaeon]|jgi:hypothetical protein|nr:hypothetical protein [archaeon]MBT6182271.1 hypothetical protein [archaeon]MBT6606352.1 hypothetical protein [archaeon]MBT7251479.1 hypothetical protein [archaeon]MBT7660725.1 hypothetical protein [archaeon]